MKIETLVIILIVVIVVFTLNIIAMSVTVVRIYTKSKRMHSVLIEWLKELINTQEKSIRDYGHIEIEKPSNEFTRLDRSFYMKIAEYSRSTLSLIKDSTEKGESVDQIKELCEAYERGSSERYMAYIESQSEEHKEWYVKDALKGEAGRGDE